MDSERDSQSLKRMDNDRDSQSLNRVDSEHDRDSLPTILCRSDLPVAIPHSEQSSD